MNIKHCQIIYRYGVDDFSVWDVDVDEKDYFFTLIDAGVHLGDIRSLLVGLPIDDGELHFHLKKLDGKSWILTSDQCKNFIDKYGDTGCSVRGSLKDIIEELEINEEV